MSKHSVQLFLIAASLLLPTVSGAQVSSNARIALHAAPHSKLACDSGNPNAQGIPCSAYTTSWPLNQAADVYLVVRSSLLFGTYGILGLSCGIDYNAAPSTGVDVSDWSLCADLDFPNGNWPDAGGGIRITWASANCQIQTIGAEGIHAVAGVFYVFAYGEDALEVTENLNLASGPEFQVGYCNAAEGNLPLTRAGAVAFSNRNVPGCNPCLVPCSFPVPAEASTWGALKGLYED